MPVISGILRDGAGAPLTGCVIQLRATTTSRDVLVTTVANVSTGTGQYYIEVLPGSYDVFLRCQGALREDRLGTIHVYDDSPDGTLNSFLNAKNIDTRPESLMQFETLVQQAQAAVSTSENSADAAKAAATAAQQHAADVELSTQEAKASETHAASSELAAASSALQAELSQKEAESNAQNAKTSETNAKGSEEAAAQALKEAQEIAKTPGPSAYDVWVSQQPTGVDTTMNAYLAYQKGRGIEKVYVSAPIRGYGTAISPLELNVNSNAIDIGDWIMAWINDPLTDKGGWMSNGDTIQGSRLIQASLGSDNVDAAGKPTQSTSFKLFKKNTTPPGSYKPKCDVQGWGLGLFRRCY